MPKSTQTNKEFVEAAGIAERDAFIAVAIRRIVAQMTEIPARELVADITFDDVMKRKGKYTDWDEGSFLIELEELFNVDIEVEKGWEETKKAGYSNWFYNPDNYRQFSFLWKPFYPKTAERQILFGEWVKLAVEVVLASVRDKIPPPSDWPGLESSDLASDAIAPKSSMHDGLRRLHWGCLGLLAIVVIVLLVSIIITKG